MIAYFFQVSTLKSCILTCTRFNSQHRVFNSYRRNDDIVCVFLTDGKVFHVISYWAAAMLKGFQLPVIKPIILENPIDRCDDDDDDDDNNDNDNGGD